MLHVVRSVLNQQQIPINVSSETQAVQDLIHIKKATLDQTI